MNQDTINLVYRFFFVAQIKLITVKNCQKETRKKIFLILFFKINNNIKKWCVVVVLVATQIWSEIKWKEASNEKIKTFFIGGGFMVLLRDNKLSAKSWILCVDEVFSISLFDDLRFRCLPYKKIFIILKNVKL